ncbi:MAG: hypothetical protein ABF446_08345 [Acetobacter orientalis]|uniref:hypothetical protein n=1 Tax=Acetobacter orientalis TaxID=146474 RepID=UPI0039EBA2AE
MRGWSPDNESALLKRIVQDALEHGVVITQPEACLRILHPDTLRKISARMLSGLRTDLCEGIVRTALEECGLLGLLTNQALLDWQLHVTQALRHRASNLQLHEIQTEVLLSLSSQLNSSDSSSVQDGESVGELPTPSRTETVAASGDTEEAARTHGGAA